MPEAADAILKLVEDAKLNRLMVHGGAVTSRPARNRPTMRNAFCPLVCCFCLEPVAYKCYSME